MSITYYITDHMLAGFYNTKALQGALFVKFREVIVGWKHVDTLQLVPPSTKERVVNMYKVKYRKKVIDSNVETKDKMWERRNLTQK